MNFTCLLLDSLMSILIRYSYTLLFSLFHYFLYIVNPLLCTPALTQPHTITLALASLDQSHLFDGHMFYKSHVLFLFLVSPMCTLPRSDQSRTLTLHSQALSIASLWMSLMLSFLLTICIQLACIYLSTHTIYPYKFPPEFRISTYTLHRTAFASHHFASYHTALQSHHLYHTPHLEMIPYPQIAPSEPHRIYT